MINENYIDELLEKHVRVKEENKRLKEENNNLREALEELVLLKQWHDKGVNTAEYIERKPIAWETAKALINKP